MDLLELDEIQLLGRTLRDARLKIAQCLTPVSEKKASKNEVSPGLHSGIDYIIPPATFGAVKRACALELELIGAVSAGQARAAEKLAEVSPDQARRSLDRLDTLERNKPTLGQAARYGAVGGLGGAAIGAVGNAIEHGGALKGGTLKAKVLNLGANAAKGAIGGSALPLARAHLDRRAELGTLRRFMQEEPHA